MLNKSVCLFLLKAQLCSDAGKGMTYTNWVDKKIFSEAEKYGYKHKDFFIEKALKKICQLKGKSGFSYYFEEGDIPGSYLIYFNFKLDGRKQISFHSFKDWSKTPYFNTGHFCKWNGKYGGSRDAAEELYMYYQWINNAEYIYDLQY